MRDLTRANELISQIASKYSEITPIVPEDFPLFQSFFAKEPHTYGNSWTYVTQGMYGIGPNKLGYKYYDGKNLSAITVYPRVEDPNVQQLFWIRPMGTSVVNSIVSITKKIRSEFSIPVYIKKLCKPQYDQFLSHEFQDVSVFPWHSLYKKEDDTFPELIIDIQKTLETAKHRNEAERLGSAYRYFESYTESNEVAHDSLGKHVVEAKKMIEDFFAYSHLYTKMPVISDPFDYFAMIEGLSVHDTTVDRFFTYKKTPVGFYFVEKQSETSASLYAQISLRDVSNHIVDYIMFDLLHRLNDQGIQQLNLGGSENENLHFFKQKFLPIKENQMYWVVLL